MRLEGRRDMFITPCDRAADNGFIHQLDEYVVFKGFECVVVKPMSAAAARAKTHALPKPDDSAGINQKHRKR